MTVSVVRGTTAAKHVRDMHAMMSEEDMDTF